MKYYMYQIARRDIPILQQGVQASHAGLEYAYLYGRPPEGKPHPSIVVLTVANKQQLEELIDKMDKEQIQYATFHEPYCNLGLTAMAVCIPDTKRHLFKNLTLWGKA